MSNAISCAAWRLYVIVDQAAAGGRDPAWIAAQAIRGGADVVQLRDKAGSTRDVVARAQAVLQVARDARVPLIINDRVDVAAAVGADGVHLGQDDLPVSAARRILGPDRLIGKSTHSLEQALDADREAVDYLAVGPLYPTPTKPDYPPVGVALIHQVKGRVRRPLVVIGGVEQATLADVLRAGASCVAVVRAVCAADDPEAAARELKRALTQFVPSPSCAGL
ncbi:MAG: thiamine phosphate synthase [Candidatus Omnitrophica bacterium]|nr:thiamine phosphate synthase [Candidatus Omnitrophota bacterium]